ncbi:MAG: DNA gyrase inhibitor YacG [Alkalimonas sp.]|nr:DNA gyrase inhibitor YacG [Alkalimonas sp.]
MSAPVVNCPTCETKVVWSDASPFRPFCSERCKLIDLGDWAAENHRIAGKPDLNAELGEEYLAELEDELMNKDNEFFRS